MNDELDPTRDPDLSALVARLERARPLPAPAFRGALRRRLEGGPTTTITPARLRRLIAAYSLSGALLLGAAGLSVVGVGPLSADGSPNPQAARPAAHAGD